VHRGGAAMAKVPSIVVVFLAGLGLTVGPSLAEACSCMPPGPACENHWKVEQPAGPPR
jgi:hypothetical protein